MKSPLLVLGHLSFSVEQVASDTLSLRLPAPQAGYH